MNIKLLTEHHLEYLCLKGGCIGSSESTLVKMPHCWKSHVVGHVTCVKFAKWCLRSLRPWMDGRQSLWYAISSVRAFSANYSDIFVTHVLK